VVLLGVVWIALTVLFLAAKAGPAKIEVVISIRVSIAITNRAHLGFRFAITTNMIRYILYLITIIIGLET
jgi:hypothetical protein